MNIIIDINVNLILLILSSIQLFIWEFLFCWGPIEYPHLIRVGSTQLCLFNREKSQIKRSQRGLGGGTLCHPKIMVRNYDFPIGRGDKGREKGLFLLYSG